MQGIRGRILGVDYGERRIGLAVSDALGVTAQPGGTVSVSSAREALRALDEAVARHGAVHVVLGLPKSLSGAIGPKARETIRFAAAFQRTSRVPVSLWDERLTSAAAERVFDEAGLDTRKRRGKVDTMAAQLILQGYLDAHGRRDAEESGA
jgi:putative Holliday junction resolvase